MALLRTFLPVITGNPFSALIPRNTGISAQIGNYVNQATGNKASGVVNAVFGGNQPVSASANYSPAQNQSLVPPGIYDSSGNQIGSSDTVQYSQPKSSGYRNEHFGNPDNPDLSNPVKVTAYEEWLKSQGPSQEELDAAFDPILDVYNKAEKTLLSQKPGLIAEAEAQANASRQLLGNQRLSSNELLGQQETKTTAQRQQQEAQQRQLLQELQIGNQQRFGGASSAGLAASELQGREYQRNVFGIQQGAQEALQTIGQKKLEVERDYQQGLQQLEVNFQQAKNEIDRRIQDKLLEINARRGETQAAKAQARLDALQEMRNMAFQLNIARAQYETELKSQAQSNSSYLDNLANQYLSYTGAGEQAVNQFANTQPGSISSVTSRTNTGTTSPYVGQIAQRPEDQLFGQIFPTRRNQFMA